MLNLMLNWVATEYGVIAFIFFKPSWSCSSEKDVFSSVAVLVADFDRDAFHPFLPVFCFTFCCFFFFAPAIFSSRQNSRCAG